MKASLLAIALFANLLLISPSDARREIGGIAAVVNGKVITTSEYHDAKKASEQMIKVTMPPGSEQNKALAEAKNEALDRLIERELILYEFNRVGGQIKPQMIDEDLGKIIRDRFDGNKTKFLAELKKTGMTQSKFRELREKMIASDIMQRQQTRDIVYPTPAQVKAAYSKNMDKFRSAGNVEIRMITLAKTSEIPGVERDAKKLADEIYTKLKNGANFADMAKRVSEDPMAEKGGYRGVVDISGKTFRKDLAMLAMSLKTGEIHKPVEDNYNFYIIKADKRNLGSAKGFDDPKVYEACHAAALAELRKEAVDRWLKHLIKNARIKKMVK